jgi:hypothetical protein
MSYEEPAESLEYVSAAVSKARAARHGFGFPLLVLGAVTAGALPFYVLPAPSARPLTQAVSGTPLVGALGGFLPHAGQWAALYWLVTLPLAYAAGLAYCRARSYRSGVQGRALPAVVVGLGLLMILVASSPAMVAFLHLPGWTAFLHPQGDLATRGLTPLLAVSLGLVALSYLERSVTRALFAVAFVALVLLVNLYDIENLFPVVLGLSVPASLAEFPNVSLAALVLLGGGLSFGLAERSH